MGRTIHDPEIREIYEMAAKGNPEALAFLVEGHNCGHGIDDVVDGDIGGAEGQVAVFARVMSLGWMPYFQRHQAALSVVLMLMASNYADANHWADRHHEGMRTWADCLRREGILLVLAVALLEGGYEHLRAVALRLRPLAWECHIEEPEPELVKGN